jgi:hypothetical protein
MSPHILPAAYAGSANGPKWWGPPILWDPWKDWREHSDKGLDGFFNFFRRRSGSWGGDGEAECDARLAEERRRCYAREWQMPHPDYLDGCLKRAQSRWITCMKNGRPDGPGEVKEWGDEDEETWRNFGR